MKHIEKEWNDYLLKIMPKDAGVQQVIETRKAFFAGAGSLFYAILNYLEHTDDPDEVTEADMDLMEGLQKEIDEWTEQQVRLGKE